MTALDRFCFEVSYDKSTLPLFTCRESDACDVPPVFAHLHHVSLDHVSLFHIAAQQDPRSNGRTIAELLAMPLNRAGQIHVFLQNLAQVRYHIMCPSSFHISRMSWYMAHLCDASCSRRPHRQVTLTMRTCSGLSI